MKKIAIYVNGGMIEAIRSNIGQDIEVEIIDNDYYETDHLFGITPCEIKPEDRWNEIQTELEFENY